MMNRIVNSIHVCMLILTAGLALEVHAQSIFKEQYSVASELFNKGEYFDSITELKRLLFFDQTNEYRFRANSMMGYCYKYGALLDEAIKYFTIAQAYAPDDSALFSAKTEVIRCNILRHTTQNAQVLLRQLSKDKRFQGRMNEIYYWTGWVYIFEDDWAKAALEFGRIDANHPLRELSGRVEKEKYSVSFAKVISYILPGVGQFYTGEYLSGIMSLGWLGLLGYYSVESFAADRIFDGLVTTGLFLRFHRGNVQNAGKFAIEKNSEITNKALNYLQNNYEGLKP